jgi:SAM-dependent methyltransferase
MQSIAFAPQPAVVLAFREESWHGYMQAFPFLNGPRQDVDEDILASLADVITTRQPATGCEVERYSAEELALRPEVEERVRSYLRGVGLSGKALAAVFHRLAWKVRDVNPETRTILDIGCGDGLELLFLRAAAPNAQIFAIDWNNGLADSIGDLTRVQFRTANIVEYLRTSEDRFDLIFSNHVIEHMYDPDAVCGALRRLLKPDGMMVAALPLDGVVGSLWARLKDVKRLPSPLALGAIDLGHPWKTTPADLRETLLSAGFTHVRCMQKAGALNPAVAGEEKELAALEARGMFLSRRIFGSLNWLAAKMFGHRPPRRLVKLIYALERRVWFGGNNLKNLAAPELLAIGSA